MPRGKKKNKDALENIVNLVYVILGLLLVVIAGLIVLFFEIG